MTSPKSMLKSLESYCISFYDKIWFPVYATTPRFKEATGGYISKREEHYRSY
jgi:hypothetical protein